MTPPLTKSTAAVAEARRQARAHRASLESIAQTLATTYEILARCRDLLARTSRLTRD